MQKPIGLAAVAPWRARHLAVDAGRAVPCPERKLKGAATCFRAGFYLPAAGPSPVTAVLEAKRESKSDMYTLNIPELSRRTARCVRFAKFVNEDTGEETPLYLHSHEEIDAEIDWRILREPDRAAHHEATRTRFHTALNAA